MNDLPFELLGEITKAVKGDFIAWTSTCKTLNSLNTVSERAKRSNHLLTLLKMFPDKPWDCNWLSKNPNITWEYICANPEIEWNYYWLCMNKNITWEIVQAHPNRPWNYKNLSRNSNITWEIVEVPDNIL